MTRMDLQGAYVIKRRCPSAGEVIEALRAELEEASLRYGLRDERVLAISETLDAFLVEYQRAAGS